MFKRLLSFLIVFLHLYLNSIMAQELTIINQSFEQPGSNQSNWTNIDGWSGSSGGISNNEFYYPVDGKFFAYQIGNGEWISQETNEIIQAGKNYTLTVYARSMNPKKVSATTTVQVGFYFGNTEITSLSQNVNAPQLKGVAATIGNDDGANVWIDGYYRHQFNDVHMYQPISFDPINDPWEKVDKSNYSEIRDELGWAVGNVIVGDQKYIYGTIYRDRPGNFYSSINVTKALSSEDNDYTWSDPVTVFSHSGSEFPWVEDAHCYYDESTGRLWMAWGGGTCYVSELDPADGMLIDHPENVEFDTHPEGTHIPVATWPETRQDWCGDRWSVCWMEGAALYKHNGYWYYFGSYGNLSKDYTIRMGRGTSPTGPFWDKDNINMMEFDPVRNVYGNTMLLGEESNQLVPGHPHIWEEEGEFYLGYDFRRNSGRERDLMGIRRLYWVNEWPTIYMPITVSFNANDYPEAIGNKLGVFFCNIGESDSKMAVDFVTLKLNDDIKVRETHNN